MGHAHFPSAQATFKSHGFSNLEYCDIDEERNEAQLDRLDEYDVIYLTGGDPIGFRRNILRAELPTRLQRCLAACRLIVGSSGGSMQLTRNVSLFRLVTEPVDDVLATRDDYDGLGFVEYEVLPHLNRHDPSMPGPGTALFGMDR